MMNREINRQMLASFIEYAVAEKISASEWERFIINHYSDPVMEEARSECARVLGGHLKEGEKSEDMQSYLYEVAKGLRNAT